MIQPHLKTLVDLRKSFHKMPELSGKEKKTAKKVKNVLKNLRLFKFIPLGRTSFLATYNSGQAGKNLVFRAELDALPIAETNQFDYKSEIKGIGHKCGHDGHLTILIGLAQWLKKNPIKTGSVSLLFQSAEETGEGAKKVLKKWPQNFQPDAFYALHNLPGYDFGQVLCKAGTFSAASKGIIIKFKGKESHAAEPQNGISPFETINKLVAYALQFKNLTTQGLITPIHTKIGQPAFGTSPGKGVVMFTLRTLSNAKLQNLEHKFLHHLKRLAEQSKIEYKVSSTDHFYHTQNKVSAYNQIKKVCSDLKMNFIKMEEPFAWSEDFGRFTHQFSGAMFAIGAGKNWPALHNPHYDFNDDLIPLGIEIFSSIIKNQNKI